MHMTQNALVPTCARRSNPQTGRQILEQKHCPGRPPGPSIERRGTTSKLAQIAPKRPGTPDAEIHTGSRGEGADLHRRRLLAKPGSSKLREHRALATGDLAGRCEASRAADRGEHRQQALEEIVLEAVGLGARHQPAARCCGGGIAEDRATCSSISHWAAEFPSILIVTSGCPEGSPFGSTDASATRTFSRPCSRRRRSTLPESEPEGWRYHSEKLRM
mmetsp:Transcript_122025/g.390180  ORF Transcript_122025/g.390180 Transcript_122025/m.390180 type:complete len:218 (-) Transcript_122025:527-1180(-)